MPSEAYTGEPSSPLLPPIAIPKPASLIPIYVAIVLGSMLIGSAFIVGVSLVRPAPADNAALISTALTGLGVATLQALNFIKSTQAVAVATQATTQIEVLHKSVNSGFEEFARLIRAEAKAEGVKETEAKQIDLAAIEARIAEGIRQGIAAALPAAGSWQAQPADVVTIQPGPIQDIAEAVRPAVTASTIEAITGEPPVGQHGGKL